MKELTAERVRELLSYDPETGVVTWRVKKCNRCPAGSIAGSKRQDGYVSIMIDGNRYLVHRLAWLITYGIWPIEYIDHINRIPGDNRLANLREASNTTNMQNIHGPRANNKSGYLGVSWDLSGKSFRAIIVVQGKQRYLGGFADPSDAYDAYLSAKRILHPGNTL